MWEAAFGRDPELAGNVDMKTLSMVHIEAEMGEEVEDRGGRQRPEEEEGASVDKRNTMAADIAVRRQGGHGRSPEGGDSSYMLEAI